MIHVELEVHGAGGVEIRCCCNPERLYGWLPLNGEPRIGQRFRFPIPPTRDDVGTVTPGGEVLLEVATVTLGSFCPLTEKGYVCEPLRVEELQRESHPALKYHGDDLDFADKARQLLHVPGFEPSPETRAVLGLLPALGIVWP